MNIDQLLSKENPIFLSDKGSNGYITRLLDRQKPKLVGRFGSIEGRVVGRYLLGLSDKNDNVLETIAQSNAGICQATPRSLTRFSCEYLASAINVDLLAAWDFPHQLKLAEISAPEKIVRLPSIDPLFAYSKGFRPWTRALSGKRVLVIHPFEQSIRRSYANRAESTLLSALLPDFELQVIKPPVTTGEGVKYEHGWSHYLMKLKRQVLAQEFDVALIGAGSYGLPIASFVKTIGKPAIHLGGVLQLMFGIMGGRWERQRYIARIGYDGWVRPDESETPSYAKSIEGGCYW